MSMDRSPNIGFHFQGQFCIAKMQGRHINTVSVDGIELNLLPEMLPEIMKAYHEIQAGAN